jgi:hypothetical protein
MVRPGLLCSEERLVLVALARDGPVTHRLARRANALVFLEDGLSCEQVGRLLLLDDDTIRRWHGDSHQQIAQLRRRNRHPVDFQ